MTTDEATAQTLADLRAGGDLAAGLAYFDALPAVEVEEMLGAWRGSGFDTGHPLDGLLEQFAWHGKRFEGVDAVHPLVVRTPRGLRYVDPARLAMPLVARAPRVAHHPVTARIFPLVRPLLLTRRPKARVCATHYRGVVSATMVYRDLPIHDVFRRVDGTTLLGVSEMAWFDRPLLFVLEREG
ncbi:MAG: GXWXG domain-containing protein [Sporichthyaceae bacterium]